MALEGNTYSCFEIGMPLDFTPKGRRLLFRLQDKFGLSGWTVKELIKTVYPNKNVRDFCDTATVHQIIRMYLRYHNNVVISEEDTKKLIQVLDFDARHEQLVKMDYKRVMELLEPPVVDDTEAAKHLALPDYSRGFEIGQDLFFAASWLIDYSRQKERKLVVYGRDAEIMYDVIQYLNVKDPVPVCYVIISRNQLHLLNAVSTHPLLTVKKSFNVVYRAQHGKKISITVNRDDYFDFIEYIKSAVSSPEVINVDTGVFGSVQRRVFEFLSKTDKRFAGVNPDIKMLKSGPRQQIPVAHVASVVNAIEHHDQKYIKAFRLGIPKRNPAAFRYKAFIIGVLDRINEKKVPVKAKIPLYSNIETCNKITQWLTGADCVTNDSLYPGLMPKATNTKG